MSIEGSKVEAGTLYVVATPIGNLGDMSDRARRVLAGVDCIAAEDTRHTGKLLSHFGIATPQISLHEHNELERVEMLLGRLRDGQAVALVSDAGTPLISDPGYRLVHAVRAEGLRVCPVPGPSALIAALSACGLPTDHFVFEGFLPAKAAARRARLEGLAGDSRTLVFYESSHRIEAALNDMAEVLGVERPAVVAREITKAFEQFEGGGLGALARAFGERDDWRKGEFVVVVGPVPEAPAAELDPEAMRVLTVLVDELPVKQAARIGSQILGVPKNRLYRVALELASTG